MFRRQTELLTKGAGERFVGTVACIQGDGQNIRSALDKRLGGFAEPAGTPIGRHGQAASGSERVRKVKARHPDAGGDRVEGDVTAEVALDIPKGFAGNVHGPRVRSA